jgi:hypothetical protein
MEEKLRGLYDFLNSRHLYYTDFIRYEQLIGNTKNADVLDARSSELYFVMNELLRLINSTK